MVILAFEDLSTDLLTQLNYKIMQQLFIVAAQKYTTVA